MNLKSGWLVSLLLLFLIAPEARPVTLALVGDLMLGRSIAPAFRADDGATFAGLEPWLRSADLSFGNLESPFSRAAHQAENEYDLCAPLANLEHLRQAGFDVVSIANNHRGDCGDAETSLRLVAEGGLRPVADGYQVMEMTVRGTRLAFLAADDVSSAIDLPRLSDAVRSAHARGAFVIVSLHWGLEYQPGPSARQRRIAVELTQAGAGLIVGHHPHVVQPAECIDGGPGRPPTLVLYSLGNSLFDQNGLPGTRQGLLAFVRVSPAGEVGFAGIPFQIRRMPDGFRLLPDEDRPVEDFTCR